MADKMEFFETIKKRHTYRGKFKDTEIPTEDLNEILDAGIKAPSGLNSQSTSFLVLTDKNARAKINHILGKETTATAPVIILVLTSPAPTSNGISFELEDYGAATENLLLAITAKGYASVWMDGVLKFNDKAARIREEFNIPESLNIRAVLPVGVPENETKQKEKKPFSERVFFDHL